MVNALRVRVPSSTPFNNVGQVCPTYRLNDTIIAIWFCKYMSILASILTGIITLTIVFLLYGYMNGLFNNEKRQDFIIKTRNYCKLILGLPFTFKLLILLFVILLFTPLGRYTKVIVPLTAIPLVIIYYLIGDSRKNIVADIIIKCFILFIMFIILSKLIPILITS